MYAVAENFRIVIWDEGFKICKISTAVRVFQSYLYLYAHNSDFHREAILNKPTNNKS